MIYPFMQSLRESPLPSPGNTVKITSFIPESGTEVQTHKTHSLRLSRIISSRLTSSQVISLTRPADSWLEHVDFHELFRRLTDEEVLLVFTAAVMERRVVFISEELR